MGGAEQPQQSQQKSQQHPQPPQKNGKDELKAKSKRNKKSKKKSKSLTDPMKILADVLSKGKIGAPNLSQIVDEKFYHSPDYQAKLIHDLSDITYEPTISETHNGHADVDISVLPLGFKGQVNLSPIALTNLSCINHKPQRRPRNKKQKKKPKPKQPNQKKDQQRPK